MCTASLVHTAITKMLNLHENASTKEVVPLDCCISVIQTFVPQFPCTHDDGDQGTYDWPAFGGVGQCQKVRPRIVRHLSAPGCALRRRISESSSKRTSSEMMLVHRVFSSATENS